MMTRKEVKSLDKEISRIYQESCAGIQIDIFDISSVFAEGRKAHMEGRDIKEAIVSYVQTIRKN